MSLDYTAAAAEVRYLHSLWHLGPPRGRNPNLRPAPKPFKRKQNKPNPTPSDPPVDIEWCRPPAPAPETAGWADPAPPPARPPPSADDLARTSAAEAQRIGVRACKEFFSLKDDDDDDDDDDDEDDDDDDSGSGAFDFFLGLFRKERDLRVYYEEKWEKGDFCCLVCEGVDALKGKGRRFSSCVGLMSHCNSTSKTNRRAPHQALAKVLCRVLGWNFQRLPSIVLDLGDTLGKSLEKLVSDTQVEGSNSEKEEPPKEIAGPVSSNTGDENDCLGIKDTRDLSYEEDTENEKEKSLKEVGEGLEATK